MDLTHPDIHIDFADTYDSRGGAVAPPRAPIADPTWVLTPAGEEELRGGVTSLSLPALELLLRLDGRSTVSQVRLAMARHDPAAFDTAFATLRDRRLVRETEPDAFDALSTQQLRMLSTTLGAPGAGRPARDLSNFSVGLVRRRDHAVARDAGTLRAVVVEDEPALARFVECFLALEGLQVTLAANRAEVVAALRTPPLPDVVLLDGTLPDADGFDVLAKLRQHPTYRHVPVIMLTARATREAVLQAICAGADGYLTKPFDAEALVQAVRAVTGLADPQAPSGFGPDPWGNHDARLRAPDARVR